MPPLSIGPIINGLKESIENPRDAEALKNSFRRIIEALEEVEQVYNTNYNNPQNLNFGFLTHRLERPEDLPNYRRLVAGANIVFANNAATRTLTVRALASVPDYLTQVRIVEDFVSGGIADGTVGQLGWSYVGTGSYGTAEVNHPGLFRVTRSASADAYGTLELNPIGSTAGKLTSWHSDELFDFTFYWVRRQTSSETLAMHDFRIGCSPQDITTAANPPTDGIYFESLAADSPQNWYVVTRAGSSETRNTTGVTRTAFDAFVKMRIRREDASTIAFSINDGTEILHDANIFSEGCQAFIQVHTSNGTHAARFEADLFDILFDVVR